MPGNAIARALIDFKSGYVLGIVSAGINEAATGIRTSHVSYALKSSVIPSFIRRTPQAAAIPALKPVLPANPASKQVIIGHAGKASVLVLIGKR